MLLKENKDFNSILSLINSSNFLEAKKKLDGIVHECSEDFAFYNIIAQVCERLGKVDEAINNYILSIKLNNNFYHSKFSLAIIYYKLKDLDNAQTIFNQLIKEYPEDFNSYYNLGIIKFEREEISESIILFKKAIVIKKDFSAAYHHLAMAYEVQKNFELAIIHYQEAIKFNKENFSLSYNNLGNVYIAVGEYEKAIDCFNHALNLQGKKSSIYFNLGIANYELNNISQALKYFEKSVELDEKNIKFTSTLLGCSYFLDSKDFYYKKFLDRYRKNIEIFDLKKTVNFCYQRNSKIKLGILSGGFRQYPTGYFLLDFLEKINKEDNFELYAFSSSTQKDNYTNKLKKSFHYWEDVNFLNDLELFNLIRSKGINVLIDMQGHTYDNRIHIFANKVAPLQISWAAYLGSTGIAEIDYILGDPFVTPDIYKDIYVEKIWNLPDIWCTLSTSDIKHISPAESPFNKNGFITFGCFNNVKKINESLIDSWSKILTSLTNSKLYIKSDQFKKKKFTDIFKKKFTSLGVQDSQLIFEESSAREELLKCYNKIDIALDTFPYSGGTTSFELSFMCVPLITISGNNFISRCGVSINKNLNTEDLIAKDLEQYIKVAIDLGKNPNKINYLRSQLIKNSRDSNLFNAAKFGNNFVVAIKEMWTIFLKQNKQF